MKHITDQYFPFSGGHVHKDFFLLISFICEIFFKHDNIYRMNWLSVQGERPTANYLLLVFFLTGRKY